MKWALARPGAAPCRQGRVTAVPGVVDSTVESGRWPMFRCSPSCRAGSQASMQRVYQCTEPLTQAQALVTSQVKSQNRLAQSIMRCNDKAKALMPKVKSFGWSSSWEIVWPCVDDSMNLIPTMIKKLEECLSSIQNRSLCHWSSGLRAGIYFLKEWEFRSFKWSLWIKDDSKFKAYVTCLWTLVPLCFNSRKCLWNLSQSFWEPKFLGASAYPGSRHLHHTKPEPSEVPDSS